MQSIKHSIVTLLILVLGFALVAPATAAPARKALVGLTVVTLSQDYIAASRALQLTTSPIFPSKGGTIKPSTPADAPSIARKVSFPIVGGVLDYANAFGEVIHSGGLTIRGGNTKVTLTEFIIDTTLDKPALTGLVTANGNLVGRVPLFDLVLPPLQLPFSSRNLKLNSVGLNLSKEAADALNSIFGVTAFTEGLRIGHGGFKATFSTAL